MTRLLRPRARRPGDLVVIAALSGPLPTAYESHVDRTVAVFERMGFRVRRAPLLRAGRHRQWSAAAPAEIAREFNGLLRDPEVRAIVAGPGGAEGRLIGGVINRVVLAQATPFALPLDRFDGAVLFWEEIGGLASYVWSHLHILRHSGILDRISGMVVGVPRDITGLEPGASPALAEIVLDVLGDRNISVLGNVDVGHAGPNLPIPVGVRARLDAGRRTLSLLEPAVRA